MGQRTYDLKFTHTRTRSRHNVSYTKFRMITRCMCCSFIVRWSIWLDFFCSPSSFRRLFCVLLLSLVCFSYRLKQKPKLPHHTKLLSRTFSGSNNNICVLCQRCLERWRFMTMINLLYDKRKREKKVIIKVKEFFETEFFFVFSSGRDNSDICCYCCSYFHFKL